MWTGNRNRIGSGKPRKEARPGEELVRFEADSSGNAGVAECAAMVDSGTPAATAAMP